VALIVEDGSGVAEAESYVSVEAAGVFFSARDLAPPAEGLLRRAMDYLETLSWAGRVAEGTQPLAFPRAGLTNRNGAPLGADLVPPELVRAQLWLAYYIGQGTDPGAPAALNVRREKVGPIDTEYAVGVGARHAIRIEELPRVYRELEPFLANDSGTLVRTSVLGIDRA